jgi:hypothetical protein
MMRCNNSTDAIRRCRVAFCDHRHGACYSELQDTRCADAAKAHDPKGVTVMTWDHRIAQAIPYAAWMSAIVVIALTFGVYAH